MAMRPLTPVPDPRSGLPQWGSGGILGVMAGTLREDLFKLPAAERLALLEELWDSLSEDDEALVLTDEQRADLERRLAEADADPTGAAPWEEVRERIRSRHSR